MVPVRQAIPWSAVTNLLLMSMSAVERVPLVAVSLATDVQSIAVAVANFAMASTVFCRYTWLAAWWSTKFVVW